MIFNDDNTFSNFFMLGLVGSASYFLGKKMAQNEMVEQTAQAQSQNQIAELNKQVNDLKMVIYHLVQNQKNH